MGKKEYTGKYLTVHIRTSLYYNNMAVHLHLLGKRSRLQRPGRKL